MRFFFLLLLIPLHLFAEWDSLFSTDEDPALFHHVHVISGQLNIAIEDAKLQGAYPFSLTRTYCSSAGSQPDNLTLQTNMGSKCIIYTLKTMALPADGLQRKMD